MKINAYSRIHSGKMNQGAWLATMARYFSNGLGDVDDLSGNQIKTLKSLLKLDYVRKLFYKDSVVWVTMPFSVSEARTDEKLRTLIDIKRIVKGNEKNTCMGPVKP